jgi:hypothetical protein
VRMKRLPRKVATSWWHIKAVSIAPAAARDASALLWSIALFAVSNDSHQIERARIKRLRASCSPRHFIHSLRLIFPRDHSNEFKCAAASRSFPLGARGRRVGA